MALGVDRVTAARNYCKHVGKRCIKVIQGGKGHSANNVVEDWFSRAIVASKDDAQLYVDHNIFVPGDTTNEVGEAQKEDTDTLGRWEGVHNYEYGGNVVFREETSIDDSFKSDSRDKYDPTSCDDDDCWEDLYDQIVSEAGTSVTWYQRLFTT